MKKSTLCLLLALAGCQTPGQLTQDVDEQTATLTLPPAEATVCITRNLDRTASNAVTDRRPLGTNGQEIVARITGNVTTIYAVVHLHPAGTGSTAKLWIVPHLFRSPDAVARDMVDGC